MMRLDEMNIEDTEDEWAIFLAEGVMLECADAADAVVSARMFGGEMKVRRIYIGEWRDVPAEGTGTED
jgi:hypothetical protein